MRLRNIPGAREYLAGSQYVVQNPTFFKGKWYVKFGDVAKAHPLHLEIGTGKGRFIMDMAERNPDIRYVGIEKYSSVLLRAVQKEEERELTNLFFIRFEAELLGDIFEKGEVDRIYLNFSDPWPKRSAAGRRLPSKEHLRLYREILADDGTIEFKTDNRALFDFAIDEIDAGGFKLDAVTYDLHNDPVMNEGNVMTEYEEKFSAKGNRICKYIISKKPSSKV